MISIIICSKSLEMFAKIEKNITDTIGEAFEMIRINNELNEYSICRAYNKGAERASYPYLCFVHEDVTFCTNDWGSIAMRGLNEYDLLGVAGSSYKSQTVSGCATGNSSLDYGNIFHLKKNGGTSHYLKNETGSGFSATVVLDGVWMFCKKVLWQKIQFAEKSLTGFHFYDLDFSFRCSLNHKLAVIFSIDIVHNSLGSFGDEWLMTAIAWHKANKKRLPHFIGAKTKQEISVTENAVATFWLKRLKNEPISKYSRLLFLLAIWRKMPKRISKELLRLLTSTP